MLGAYIRSRSAVPHLVHPSFQPLQSQGGRYKPDMEHMDVGLETGKGSQAFISAEGSQVVSAAANPCPSLLDSTVQIRTRTGFKLKPRQDGRDSITSEEKGVLCLCFGWCW